MNINTDFMNEEFPFNIDIIPSGNKEINIDWLLYKPELSVNYPEINNKVREQNYKTIFCENEGRENFTVHFEKSNSVGRVNQPFSIISDKYTKNHKFSECFSNSTSDNYVQRHTGSWTTEEDLKLNNWVKINGPKHWPQCAQFITGRSSKQCRERWLNILNPTVKKGNWTIEEDYFIFKYFSEYGSKWSKIVSHFPGRTQNCIKNRFYCTLRKFNKRSRQSKTNLLNNKECLIIKNQMETKGKSYSLEYLMENFKECSDQISKMYNEYLNKQHFSTSKDNCKDTVDHKFLNKKGNRKKLLNEVWDKNNHVLWENLNKSESVLNLQNRIQESNIYDFSIKIAENSNNENNFKNSENDNNLLSQLNNLELLLQNTKKDLEKFEFKNSNLHNINKNNFNNNTTNSAISSPNSLEEKFLKFD